MEQRAGSAAGSRGVCDLPSPSEVLVLTTLRPMQSDVDQNKGRSIQHAKKDEGWREREEARTARVTPRESKKGNARESTVN